MISDFGGASWTGPEIGDGGEMSQMRGLAGGPVKVWEPKGENKYSTCLSNEGDGVTYHQTLDEIANAL